MKLFRSGPGFAFGGVLAALLAMAIIVFSFQRYQQAISDNSRLVIYSYSSFAAAWGPGPTLVKMFQEKTRSAVELVDAGDAGTILNRLSLEDKKPDVVIGLDQLALAEAVKKHRWTEIESGRELVEKKFIGYDRAPMTFIYRKGEIEPPRDFKDLLHPRFNKAIALEDPRTSTPGAQFLSWLAIDLGPDWQQYVKDLLPNIHSVSPSWSTAYGLFKKKQAKLVFSYNTSAAYHWIEDKDERYQAVKWTGRLVEQVEYAGIPEGAPNVNLAKTFLQFLQEPVAQKVIMEKNYMLPVATEVQQGTVFDTLPKAVLIPASEQMGLDQASLRDLWTKLFR